MPWNYGQGGRSIEKSWIKESEGHLIYFLLIGKDITSDIFANDYKINENIFLVLLLGLGKAQNPAQKIMTFMFRKYVLNIGPWLYLAQYQPPRCKTYLCKFLCIIQQSVFLW